MLGREQTKFSGGINVGLFVVVLGHTIWHCGLGVVEELSLNVSLQLSENVQGRSQTIASGVGTGR